MEEVNEIVKYLSIGGMFQIKDGFHYDSFEDINVDPFTFKQYDMPIRINSHGMPEF